MRHQVEIFVNGGAHTVAGTSAFASLAEYLRDSLRLTGTKTACNEGDCGTCTVLVGRRSPDKFAYQAVNSCITRLFQLDAAHIITIEGLTAKRHTSLSTRLAEGHGIQCGYCTPGIVMAMTAAENANQESNRPWTPEAIRQTLTGNLCRCTGYKQIVEALRSSHGDNDVPLEQIFPSGSLQNRNSASDCIVVNGDGGRILCLPATLQQGLDYLAKHPKAEIVNGATDVAVEWVTSGAPPNEVLYLGRIPSLAETFIGTDIITVGASVSIASFSDLITPIFTEFSGMIPRFGSAQIRHSATLGGNIAGGSPIADCLPLLFACGAEVELVSAKGSRRMLVEDFVLDYKSTALEPGELLSRVFIPRPSNCVVCRVYKVSKRSHLDIGTVTAAIVAEVSEGFIQSARVAFGGIGPTVLRLRRVEGLLSGQPYCEETFERAAHAALADLSPQDDVRGSAEYRRRLVSNLIQQYYWDTCEAIPQVEQR